MNKILKELNDKHWLLMFSWQMPNGLIYMVFKRTKEPSFVISSCGSDENRIFGEINTQSSWIEEFIKENKLESKFKEFSMKKSKSIKYVKDNVRYNDM